MAKNNILWHFTRTPGADIPAPFNNRDAFVGQYKSPKGRRTSVLQSNIKVGKSESLTSGFVKALLRAKMIWNGCDKDGFGYNDKMSVAEYTDSGVFTGDKVGNGEILSVAYNISTGEVLANRAGGPFNSAKESSAPIFLALWPLFLKDAEFFTYFENFCMDTDDDDCLSEALVLAGLAYSMTAQTANVKGSLPIQDSNNVTTLSDIRIQAPNMKPATYYGNFQKFSVTKAKNGKKAAKKTADGRAMKTADFVGHFKFTDRVLDDELLELVPKIDEKYIVNDTLVLICKHIKESTGKSLPIRNILLRGEPGTGKTAMGVAIAAGCGLPYYSFAANAMTEPFDLFGQFVPIDDEGNQIGAKVSVEEILKGLPTAEDMSMDPVYSYQQITGTYKKDATPLECMNAAFNIANKSLNANAGQQRFKFVPGQLIYAMKNGGVYGLDEVTLPQNPGVIPALNPAMDGTQAITLPTGQIIKRHPDCIFVGTTNIDLEGCRRMNQAWMDRCQLVIDIPDANDDELIERVKSMSDYDDAVHGTTIDLDRFIRAYHELKELAKKLRLDDGHIGIRKLSAWVSSTMITGDPLLSASMTIVPGATADERGIAELTEKLHDIF